MRRVQLADLDAAVRALTCCARPVRPAMAANLLERAHIADKYRKRTGKIHPQFGSGTLSSAAAQFPQATGPAPLEAERLDAFACMIKALASRPLN